MVPVNHYYLGFYKNAERAANISILLTSTKEHQVNYSIEVPGISFYHHGTISVDKEVILNLPTSVQVASSSDQDKGIYLTTSSDKVTVIGQSLLARSSDSFFVLPNKVLNDVTYVYYAISVPQTVVHDFLYYSSVLIVGTENNTVMNLTVTQLVTISVDTTTTNLIPGKQYSFVINRLQTVYIRSLKDLSGTKIVTDKPVSVFSGHQCANVPWNVNHCNALIEQIPPTMLWGKVYYTAPLATRAAYTIKILGAYNSTNVNIYCNNKREYYTINEGELVNKTLLKQEYCAIYSNKKILVAQFSHGENSDDAIGDPMMTLVPATIQYLNEFDFSTLKTSRNFNHYINIIVIAQYYQPNMIYLIAEGVNRSLITQQWVPIKVNGIIEAYATQLNITEGRSKILHTNAAAEMMTIVYGFSQGNAYGHIGGFHFLTGY